MYYRKLKMWCPGEVTKPSTEKSMLYYQILRIGVRSLSLQPHTWCWEPPTTTTTIRTLPHMLPHWSPNFKNQILLYLSDRRSSFTVLGQFYQLCVWQNKMLCFFFALTFQNYVWNSIIPDFISFIIFDHSLHCQKDTYLNKLDIYKVELSTISHFTKQNSEHLSFCVVAERCRHHTWLSEKLQMNR
jgi:hypothetical protein